MHVVLRAEGEHLGKRRTDFIADDGDREAGKGHGVSICSLPPHSYQVPLPGLRGRCRRFTPTEGVMGGMTVMTPSVADYRDTSPEDGGG